MLKEEEGGREEEVGGVTLRRLRAEMTAVAEEWQRWRACELEVVRAAKDVGIAVSVYREAEGRCEAAMTDVEIDAAEDVLDEAEAQLDAAESSLEDAEDEANKVRVRLRAAEQRAAWAAAVRVVAHLRAGRRVAGSKPSTSTDLCLTAESTARPYPTRHTPVLMGVEFGTWR